MSFIKENLEFIEMKKPIIFSLLFSLLMLSCNKNEEFICECWQNASVYNYNLKKLGLFEASRKCDELRTEWFAKFTNGERDCKLLEEGDYFLAKIETDHITFLSQNEIETGGKNIIDGNSYLYQKGICWGLEKDPTIENNYTNNGFGTSPFRVKIENLEADKTYYIRAYAMNSKGVGYSENLVYNNSTLQGNVESLACNEANINRNITQGEVVSNIQGKIPYLNGNGGSFSNIDIFSTGVKGLKLTLTGNTLKIGSDTLSFVISGTAESSGLANFELNVLGTNCTFSINIAPPPSFPNGTVHCNSNITEIVEVISPTTGKAWMDRNIGAFRVATSIDDEQAYGDLYQWGRRADGHQCRNSFVITNTSSSNTPATSNFIANSQNERDWRNPQNSNLWQGASLTNNPCPSSYRVPTDAELNEERLAFSSNNNLGALNSFLKLPSPGFRAEVSGQLTSVGFYANYWSTTASGTRSRVLAYDGTFTNIIDIYRARGASVRCIKD